MPDQSDAPEPEPGESPDPMNPDPVNPDADPMKAARAELGDTSAATGISQESVSQREGHGGIAVDDIAVDDIAVDDAAEQDAGAQDEPEATSASASPFSGAIGTLLGTDRSVKGVEKQSGDPLAAADDDSSPPRSTETRQYGAGQNETDADSAGPNSVGTDSVGADSAGPDSAGPDSAGPDEQAPALSPYDRPGKWFVVHTQSGYEKKVKKNLEARLAVLDLEDKIHEIEIPMEDVIEFKNGRKVVVKKKIFPGYLLIRCENNESVHMDIKATPGITGYAGPAGRPQPLRKNEVELFLQTPEPGDEQLRRTKPSVIYEIDESVRIKEGPFSDFQGQVIEINEEHLRVKVLVNIFGRETPVELEFSQVAKI